MYLKRKGYIAYQTKAAYLFIMGAFLLVTIFIIVPMIGALLLGFFKYDGIRQAEFIGITNYKNILSDKEVWNSLWLTIYYMIGTLPVTITIAFILALIINESWFIKGRQLATGVFFTPYILSLVSVGFIWVWLMNPMLGVLNYFLEMFGMNPQYWLRNPYTAMPSIWIIANWKFLGFYLILYIAAMRNIPEMYYDAAKIDGISSKWQEVKYITWPLVLPTTYFLLITGFIGAFSVFDVIFITTEGGPANLTRVFVFYMYEKAFNLHRFGIGSAMAFFLFIILLGFTYFQWQYYTNRIEEAR